MGCGSPEFVIIPSKTEVQIMRINISGSSCTRRLLGTDLLGHYPFEGGAGVRVLAHLDEQDTNIVHDLGGYTQ